MPCLIPLDRVTYHVHFNTILLLLCQVWKNEHNNMVTWAADFLFFSAIEGCATHVLIVLSEQTTKIWNTVDACWNNLCLAAFLCYNKSHACKMISVDISPFHLFMSLFFFNRALLKDRSDGIEVSYNAAGTLSHILSDGPQAWTIKAPTREGVLDYMVEAIDSWALDTKRNINYR